MCRIVEDYVKERAEEARKIALAEGLKRGLKTGMQRGIQENAIATAKNFLRMNLGSPEQIAQGTGLPLEQVLALKKELEREAACVAK